MATSGVSSEAAPALAGTGAAATSFDPPAGGAGAGAAAAAGAGAGASSLSQDGVSFSVVMWWNRMGVKLKLKLKLTVPSGDDWIGFDWIRLNWIRSEDSFSLFRCLVGLRREL